MPNDDEKKDLKAVLNQVKTDVVTSNNQILQTGNLNVPIIVSEDPYVKGLWNKITDDQRYDAFAKLTSLLNGGVSRSNFDLDVLEKLNEYGAVSGGDARTKRHHGLTFILHDEASRLHICALLKNDECIILSVWEFDQSDIHGKGGNRKPESKMPMIESLYKAYMYE